ncbi:MAG: hypothetical protein AAGK22_19885 [Acidobacteriota bacterium]
MTRYALSFLALLTAFSGASAQEMPLKERYRQQLEADRAELFAMTRSERQQYLSKYFGHADREHRRAFKEALGVVRQEWNFVERRDRVDVTAAKPEPTEAPSDLQVISAAGVAAPAVGNITYDSGTVTGTAGTPSQMLGNRFDQALSTGGNIVSVPASGSVTAITFDMVNTFFGSVVWSLYTNIMGTTANQVTSMARPGIMTGLNTLAIMSPTTANAYMNGTFLAGIWQFNPTMTAVAVDTGTTAGLGFHAISLNDGGMGTGLTTVTSGGNGLNVIFRVSGTVTTPVELMDFSIEKSPTDNE